MGAAPTDETEGDFWRDVRPALQQRSKEKRADNREQSAFLLTKAGVQFESRNQGAHPIVKHGGQVYDFWPGTGLWAIRGKVEQYRGVRSLLNQIRKDQHGR